MNMHAPFSTRDSQQIESLQQDPGRPQRPLRTHFLKRFASSILWVFNSGVRNYSQEVPPTPPTF